MNSESTNSEPVNTAPAVSTPTDRGAAEPGTTRRPAAARIRNGLLLGSVAVVAVLGTLYGLPQEGAHAEKAAAPVVPAVTVAVATVEQRDARLFDTFSGRLEAVERVEVRSRVAGAIKAIHFREGALVKEGELLVSIDPEPFEAEVDEAEAQVTAAQARVELARNELERGERLFNTRTVSQRDLDERVNGQRAAEASLRAAQAKLNAVKLNLSYTRVRAPVSGRVGKSEITVGNLVAAGPGAPVLTSLVSVDPIYASFNADEATVARALAGLGAGADVSNELDRIPVLMTTSAGSAPVEGHMQLVDNQVDPRTGTVRVRARFANPDGRLLPGQFARLEMGQPKTEPALLVSERAVGTDQDKKFVFVVDAANKAVWREVTLGAPVDGLRVVTGGLTAGERVVVNGLHRVRPGAVVTPEAVPMRVTDATGAIAAPH
ncbi:efflux RND transporter periplasmic adaptor subunit [Xanthobacter dioxanivorans]|uniref:Efflux RND transporter periplasmic adaptor subunit n=2 Tax=Xanthobacter dioxanivorans TaxID=2528964 RepID=A0A974SL46_9HYPH|nr:efflux RND transporter periplasmic adaptor subunit [Xanthobacter dioxanivorans]